MMVVAGIEIELVQKDIKNLHLAVYPPDGRVRLAAPLDVNEKTLELYVSSKIPWIRRQQRRFARMDREKPRQYLNRESHYFLGKRYLLRIHDINPSHRYPKVLCQTKSYIDLYVPQDYTTDQKARLMKEWYRAQLKSILSELVPKWETILEVKASQVRVQNMRTKWGSCNTDRKTVQFNIELAKKPYECIEYVVAHELIHLIVRTHGDEFKMYLDRYIPNWKSLRDLLNLGV